MSAVQGLLSLTSVLTANGGNVDELANEFQETIFVRNSRGYNVGTTLFGLMSRLSKEPADNIEYNWFERDPVKKTIYSRSAYTSGASTITIGSTNAADGDAYAQVQGGTILMNDTTREFLVVKAVTTNSTVTVLRDAAFTTNGGTITSANAAAITAGDSFTIVTAGKAEGADPLSAIYEAPETRTNYIQTFNSTVELTNAFKGSVLRTDIDGPLTDRRIQALERIGRDIEFANFLGVRRKSTSIWPTTNGSGYQYFTGGILDGLTAASLTDVNIYNGAKNTGLSTGSNSTITLSAFNTWLSNILPYGSDTKIIFAGPTAFAAFSNFANSASNGFRIMQNENVFGMNITEIQTPFGSVGLTQHPLFREAVGLRSWMFCVDMAHIVQKTFEPLFLEPNVQSNGNDSYKEQYRAKLGVKLKFPQAFGVMYNMTGLA